jgi:acyl-CoA reductase-like NAD-dependent aldehyde dehydrogenase
MAHKFQGTLKEVLGKLFINGKLVDSKGGEQFPVINPATEEVIGHAVAATPEDVDDAVKAAREAFDHGEWRKMSAW